MKMKEVMRMGKMPMVELMPKCPDGWMFDAHSARDS
jgi:hypothetical protein